MSNEKTYSVTINAARKIPFINKNGPISSPINITKSVLEDLVKMGFPVVIRSETETTETGVTTKNFKESKDANDIVGHPKVESPEPVIVKETPPLIKEAVQVVSDETPEEITVLSEAEYNAMTKQELREYLITNEEVLNDEQRSLVAVEATTKKVLLEIVKSAFIDAAQ